MVGAVVDDADDEEQRRRGDAVGDHLEHRPVHAPLPVLRLRGPADHAASPSTTKPMWLTDEYARSFLKSVCPIATNAP